MAQIKSSRIPGACGYSFEQPAAYSSETGLRRQHF
jgi:hypothetical protein